LTITYDMPAADYHKIEALSASGAKMLLRSAAHYIASKQEQREPSAAMQLGTLVHSMVLEPDTVGRLYAAAPKFDRRTTEGKARAAEFEAASGGKTVVDMDTFQKAQRMADAVRQHPVASKLFVGGHAEVTLQWEQYGVPCKARLDYWHPDHEIVDLKTAQDASPEGFAKAVGNFRYHIQAAHYLEGVSHSHVTGPFKFVVVESEAPFAVAVYTLSLGSLSAGRMWLPVAADAFRLTKGGAGNWLGYSTDVLELEVPKWAL